MNKEKLIEKAKESFDYIVEFTEYSQHCEELLIEIIPYLSKVGLQLIIADNNDIRKDMDKQNIK